MSDAVRPARRSARPVAGRALPGGRVADRLSIPSVRILELLDAMPDRTESTPESIARGKQTLLITFRRDGSRVATPVWAARTAGIVYVRTQRPSGKVKRVRREPRVLLAPCTTRGVPTAPAVPARARLLGPAEEASAELALRRGYRLVRAACALIQDLLRVDMCYLEIVLDDSAATEAGDPVTG
ncbi:MULTISPECIES: PPOX class F420-dependent oxidoreductase [Actinoalloteichus]|uniref:PPOX class putative F420-dependent enzyme n=1 Tax=Actinoalloteichus fjordicus TaxID=1612552 RepID=A0AAC9LBM5_9PSEU|nr:MULTISPECIES: PPOX class F420-dependent oxidoreductase [Actinoalloteichus]APU14607.1 PPOX class putative F420-dependent enzyme [Actinoalloteichus fjordicus]APU20575.1 PPOX class putative F420-dependent enzyme [Actinoalloteichus sp. GBA129-24]